MRRSKSCPAPARRRPEATVHVLTLRFDGDVYDTLALDSHDMQLASEHNVRPNVVLAKERNHNAGDVFIILGPILEDPALGFVKFMGECEEMVVARAQRYVRDLRDIHETHHTYRMYLWRCAVPDDVRNDAHHRWGDAGLPLQLLDFRGRRGGETLLDKALRDVRKTRQVDALGVRVGVPCRSCVTFSGPDMEACIEAARVFVDDLMHAMTADLLLIPLVLEGEPGEEDEPASLARISGMCTDLNALGVRYDTRLELFGRMHMCVFDRAHANSVAAILRRFQIAVSADMLGGDERPHRKLMAKRMWKKRHARR